MSNKKDENADEFPILKDVVTPGDKSVIRTTRLGLEVIREIQELEQRTQRLSPAQINRTLAEQQVNELIDEIVDRHLSSLQVELKQALSDLMLRVR